jgi:hypothetical protein
MYIHQHYKPYVCCSKCFQKSWHLQVHITPQKSIWKTNMYGEREHVRDTSMPTMPFLVLDDFKVLCWLGKPMPIEGHVILGSCNIKVFTYSLFVRKASAFHSTTSTFLDFLKGVPLYVKKKLYNSFYIFLSYTHFFTSFLCKMAH